MFEIDPGPPEGHTAFFTAGTLQGYPYNDDQLQVGTVSGGWQLSSWGRNGESIGAGGKVPVKRWACLEWEVDTANGGIAVYIDGVKNFSFSTGSGHVAAFTDLGFGFRTWHPAGNPIDIWLDDVAVHTDRIGCPGR
jgi:hypothetical protein